MSPQKDIHAWSPFDESIRYWLTVAVVAVVVGWLFVIGALPKDHDQHRNLPATDDELRHLTYLAGNHLAQEPCPDCRDLHAKISRITGRKHA